MRNRTLGTRDKTKELLPSYQSFELSPHSLRLTFYALRVGKRHRKGKIALLGKKLFLIEQLL